MERSSISSSEDRCFLSIRKTGKPWQRNDEFGKRAIAVHFGVFGGESWAECCVWMICMALWMLCMALWMLCMALCMDDVYLTRRISNARPNIYQGLPVKVVVKCGEVYEGLLHTAHPSELGICLKVSLV